MSTATRIVIACLTVFLLAFHVVARQTGGQSASKIIAVRAGHLIDGRGGPPAGMAIYRQALPAQLEYPA